MHRPRSCVAVAWLWFSRLPCGMRLTGWLVAGDFHLTLLEKSKILIKGHPARNAAQRHPEFLDFPKYLRKHCFYLRGLNSSIFQVG
jgi:hypothetical protein